MKLEAESETRGLDRLHKMSSLCGMVDSLCVADTARAMRLGAEVHVSEILTRASGTLQIVARARRCYRDV